MSTAVKATPAQAAIPSNSSRILFTVLSSLGFP